MSEFPVDIDLEGIEFLRADGNAAAAAAASVRVSNYRRRREGF